MEGLAACLRRAGQAVRRAARVDGNQREIVAALLKIGATVDSLAAVGGGVPDLLVGIAGRFLLLEVKNPAKPAADRCLTPAQIRWHREHAGLPVFVVLSVDEAIAAAMGR